MRFQTHPRQRRGSDQRPWNAVLPRSSRPRRANHRREFSDTDAGSATPLTWVSLFCVGRLSRSIGGGHSDLIPHVLRVCRFNLGRLNRVGGLCPHPSRHCSVVRGLLTEVRTKRPFWTLCTIMLIMNNTPKACDYVANPSQATGGSCTDSERIPPAPTVAGFLLWYL